MSGYDVLVDKNLKPYLLEINNTPSMSPHTTLENNIKQNLLHDLLDLVDAENRQYDEIKSILDEKMKILKSMPPGHVIHSPTGGSFNISLIKTAGDMWTIVETELEYGRSLTGGFHRVFPAPHVGDKYLKYLSNRRNQLIQQWLNSGLTLSSITLPVLNF